MNASALLTAQGWRGKGHSLHKTDDAVGLAKPLLLNRKNNTKGIGATQHFTSDQWWMNAFDEQLQGLDTSKKGKVVQTITTGKLNAIEKGSLGKYSLYTTFVRGGFLEGTIEAMNKQKDEKDDGPTAESGSTPVEKSAKKLARSKGYKRSEASKLERQARKDARRVAGCKRRAEKAQLKRSLKKNKAKLRSDSRTDNAAAADKRRRRARKEEKRQQSKGVDGK
ncbi:hypothetical protein CCM_05482 [Cordyceps militaris CM01]|uniref:DNA-directed RNA polymerase II subunit RPB1 n=2 Tax=Cordyceps militaris TaxID=73501 RepID=G3JJY7_CORMM|nr:uncharacterized protein CCM_05482 [Cordyceps militaris CM01]ATY59555.1 hypothetical protein A9K55_002855 [Cordyceps militaris]EGX91324.1 hypothetical protein CCM_05482 [Cordyceps militaris CM01]